MLMLVRGCFLVLMCAALAGCAFGKKKKPASSARLYEGDSPSIRFSDEPEAAGGPLTPY